MENLDGRLVIGVSSRALFDLEAENEIFEKHGVAAYRKYQEEHEDEPLERGTAFYLVKSLLELNKQANRPIVEVVVMTPKATAIPFPWPLWAAAEPACAC